MEQIKEKLLPALTIFFLAYLIQKFCVHVIRRGIEKTKSQKQKTYLSVARATVQLIVYLVAVMMIAEVFGLSSTPMVAIASALSVALGLGSQAFIRDILSGFFILSEDHFTMGDVVTINGVTGVVESITLRATKLRNTLTGEQYILSNGDIKMVTNMSRDYRKALVDFFVPYHFDMEKTIAILEETVAQLDVDQDMISRPKFDGVTRLEPTFYVLRISCRTKPDSNWDVETKIRRTCLKALRQQGITLSLKSPSEVNEYQ